MRRKDNNQKNKAEELWDNWFTVNEKIRNDEFASANQNSQAENKQPKTAKLLAREYKLASESKPQTSVETQSGEEVEKVKKTPPKQIAAILQTEALSKSESDASKLMNEENLQMANKLPIKIPRCYSVNQVEVLQFSDNFTFAKYETDEFLQKPTPWREKFRCFRFDDHDFMYMDKRLVIPKTLLPIIMHSLHYGHPGPDSMLATISNVWWPHLHREVVAIARTCKQCKE